MRASSDTSPPHTKVSSAGPLFAKKVITCIMVDGIRTGSIIRRKAAIERYAEPIENKLMWAEVGPLMCACM